MSDSEQQELIIAFVEEGNEMLDESGPLLLELESRAQESGQVDVETLNTIFRLFHSLKGGAGFLQLNTVQHVAHEAETLLDLFRKGKGDLDSSHIDLLTRTCDFFRSLLHNIASEFNDQSCAKEARAITAVLRQKITEIMAEKPRSLTSTQTQDCDTELSYDARSEQCTHDGSVEIPNYPISPRRSIRVDVAKLETLCDLVGKLMISAAMVTPHPDLRLLPASLDGFEQASLQLNKIIRDLQDVATSIRMMPLSGTFRRMGRLVRDLSQKTGKKINLETSGENIELDTIVLEKLTDPLIHIIRNAIDHGIGTAEQRSAGGKSETGHLFLEAKHVGSEVQITVRDDGRGLDRHKILTRAVKSGLVAPDKGALTDKEICQLLFFPGFSTAETVTEVSGRGVGMDVVRRNIESIGGKVEILSEEGKGTIVNLHIPLTVARIDGMLVEVGRKLNHIK
jgi:two-component system chemotaxis sensor kinase CheA